MRHNIKLFIILFALALICQNLGPISSRLEGLLLLTSLVTYIFISCPLKLSYKFSCKKNLSNTSNINVENGLDGLPPIAAASLTTLIYISFIFIAVSISWFSNDLIQLVSLLGLLFVLFLFSRYRGFSVNEHVISILSVVCFLFVILFYTYFADCWYVVLLYSALFSNICGFIYARVLNLGPTSFGFFILISFIIYHSVIFGFNKNRSLVRFALALLYLFVATIIVIGINLLVMFLAAKTKWFYVDRNDLHTQFALFLIMCPSVLFYKELELRKSYILVIKRNFKYVIPTIIVFLAVIIFMFIPFFKSAPFEGKKVGFYKVGSLDWNIPKFGTYGQRSGGMFGLMPRHLNVLGVNSVMIDKITLSSLKDTNVLVMINLDKALSKEELLVVWDYVRNGGGLLLLGDHTDLAGLMRNFNQVLRIVNIKFKFDSAMPTRYTWDYLMEDRLHPISHTYNIEVGRSWWVGASLECFPPAEPVVQGKYCYSDWGYKNNAKNAYLGNRKFDYYEPLNDHVLAAYSRYGKGKVMVVGDTSSFHNTTFMVTNSFVLNVFRFLSNEDFGYSTLIKRILLGLLILATTSCVFFSFRDEVNIIGPLCCTLILGLVVIVADCEGYSRHGESVSFEKDEVAYIDFSHKGRFDLMSWEDDSIGGLRNNVMRNGYFPLLMRDFDHEKLLKSKLMILIAPTQPFTDGEIRSLKLFVENGGKLLITVGWEESAASEDLLSNFGLGIDGVPLGWCSYDYKKIKVQFHEAWPVIFDKDDKDVNVICEPLGYPAIVVKKYGNGSVVVIGDSYFLLNQNLEGSKKYSTSNMFLLRNLLGR